MPPAPNRFENISPLRQAVIIIVAAIVGFVLVELGLSLVWLIVEQKNIYAETWPVIHVNHSTSPTADFVFEAYTVYDPLTGYRLRPNSKLVGLSPDEQGKPAFSDEDALLIDSYGFVQNDAVELDRSFTKPEGVYRIIISGGSTVAGWGASNNQTTWPAVLERLLQASLDEARNSGLLTNYETVEVINAGVPGYNISQELTRFQTELIYMQPDLVIVFDGINEAWSFAGYPADYAVVSYQRRIEDYVLGRHKSVPKIVFLPYFQWTVTALADKLLSRPLPPNRRQIKFYQTSPVSLTADELYISKILQFKAICREYDIPFIYVLQPIMGIGHKPLTAEEIALQSTWFNSQYYAVSYQKYEAQLQTFYQPLQNWLKVQTNEDNGQVDASLIDMTGLFYNIPESVYADPRHYNDNGQRLIAEAVKELILQVYYQ